MQSKSTPYSSVAFDINTSLRIVLHADGLCPIETSLVGRTRIADERNRNAQAKTTIYKRSLTMLVTHAHTHAHLTYAQLVPRSTTPGLSAAKEITFLCVFGTSDGAPSLPLTAIAAFSESAVRSLPDHLAWHTASLLVSVLSAQGLCFFPCNDSECEVSDRAGSGSLTKPTIDHGSTHLRTVACFLIVPSIPCPRSSQAQPNLDVLKLTHKQRNRQTALLLLGVGAGVWFLQTCIAQIHRIGSRIGK